MWRQVFQRSAHPGLLLRSVLALDDSAHAIALGVSVGIFIGLTPTVGVQTVLVLALVFLTRKFLYFNATAAMAATYISNPFTMWPLYYFWYRLGTWFYPTDFTFDQCWAALQFHGLADWWNSMWTLGVQVGGPMFLGALLTAPFGVLIAYPVTYALVKWSRQPSGSDGASGTQTSEQIDATSPSNEPLETARTVPVSVAKQRQAAV
ncbi:MAG: DUF2062 domain-containing protein [Planctomycetaceae bacterium]